MNSTQPQAAGFVEDDRAVQEAGAVGPGARSGASHECPQTSRELLIGEGFRQVVVGARVETRDPIRQAVTSGQHDDRRPAAASADPPGDLQPVEIRQTDVEDDRIEARPAVGSLEAVATGRRKLDDVPVPCQEADEQTAKAWVVLDDKKVHPVVVQAVPERILKVGSGRPNLRLRYPPNGSFDESLPLSHDS